MDTGLLDFVRGLVALRRAHPVLRRHRYLTGVDAAELGWFTPAGTPMNEDCWNDPEALALGVYLDGSDAPDTGPDGQPLLDDDFLVLVNGWWEPLEFTIPDCRPGLAWRAEIDTFDPAAMAVGPVRRAGDRVTAGPRSVLVLRGPRVSPAGVILSLGQPRRCRYLNDLISTTGRYSVRLVTTLTGLIRASGLIWGSIAHQINPEAHFHPAIPG